MKLASYKIGEGEAVTTVAGKTSFEIIVTADTALSVQYVEQYPAKTIAEFKAADKSTEYKVTGIVTNMDSKAIFIQMGGDALYLLDYGKHAEGVAVGKKVTYRGKLGEYNGLLQMSNPTLVKVEDAAADEKIEATVLDETKYKALVANDAAKLVTINDLVYQDGSIAAKTNINFKLGETKVVVRFEDKADSANIIAALKNIKAGDKISLENVNLSWYNGPQAIISLVSSVKVAELSTAEKIARVKAELEGNPVVINKAGQGVTLPTYDGVTITWSLEEGATACALTEDKLGVIAATLPEADVELKAIARFTIDETAGTAEVSVTVKKSVGETTTAKVVIKDYATTNKWANATQYGTLQLDSNITVSVKGGDNTGKYYDNGNEWRIYQNESPSITITAKENYTIVSVTVTYSVKNTGILTNGTTQVKTGTLIDVNAASIVLGVGNTGTAKNGQVKITAIEVVYAAA